MSYLLILYCVFVNFFTDCEIVRIESLKEIPKQQERTLYLLDIDDTLIDFPYMLGSCGWRKYIKALGRKSGQTHWHDQFSYHLAKNYPPVTVEALTLDWINDVQNHGHIVVGFTRRERAVWYNTPMEGVDVMTVAQLNHVGISFEKERIEGLFPQFQNEPHYYEGVFFSDCSLKGDFLRQLLSKMPLIPDQIIFVDDMFKHVESVDKVLNELQINHKCYWYTACKQKEMRFDPLIADTELYYYLIEQEIISDEEASTLLLDRVDHYELLDKIYQTKN